ncbi:DUF1080 domain-containing protein [Gramella jeungdoensis]|uniref:DUF1080 domain-containing protein n=1 Tax=Gramella jeungdoensis TaxID=708091 RepID=A0ABT0Z4H9_9FLAO|nr:DUF1080 domain-containing protein [Gramella jeungdoensis]MCM8570626.1 DUF1080 domain-containing protein [Gramella jeungdoensis]
MKSPLLCLITGLLLVSTATMAQKDYPTTPPEKSPMPMKPEMTEIWEPQVEVIKPGDKPGEAPSDAIVLFDGKDLDHWVSQKDTTQPSPWKIKDGYFEVIPGTGGIQTKMEFGDVQMHIEWSAPDEIENSGQGRGNSGLFFQNRYELQILDSYNNRTYSNGQAASIYKDQPPLVNAMRSPDRWNTYDVIYTAPRFKKNGDLDTPARITVLHNGVVVQNNATIHGLTLYIGLHNYPEAHGKDVIALQDHGTPVQFRNIWVRKL